LGTRRSGQQIRFAALQLHLSENQAVVKELLRIFPTLNREDPPLSLFMEDSSAWGELLTPQWALGEINAHELALKLYAGSP